MPKAVNGLKQCSKCGETKLVSEYSKDKPKPDGLHSRCKYCIKQYRAENKEKIKEKQKQYRAKNREKRNEYQKQYYVKHTEERKEYGRQHHQKVNKTEPYVYIATVHSTGYFYIGRTTNIIRERIRKHKDRHNTGLGKHMVEHNLTLNDLEVEQHHCSSVEESTALEGKLIAENIDNPLCLNKHMW